MFMWSFTPRSLNRSPADGSMQASDNILEDRGKLKLRSAFSNSLVVMDLVLSSLGAPQRLQVARWYIHGPQSYDTVLAVRPMHLLYSYMEPLGPYHKPLMWQANLETPWKPYIAGPVMELVLSSSAILFGKRFPTAPQRSEVGNCLRGIENGVLIGIMGPYQDLLGY